MNDQYSYKENIVPWNYLTDKEKTNIERRVKRLVVRTSKDIDKYDDFVLTIKGSHVPVHVIKRESNHKPGELRYEMCVQKLGGGSYGDVWASHFTAKADSEGKIYKFKKSKKAVKISSPNLSWMERRNFAKEKDVMRALFPSTRANSRTNKGRAHFIDFNTKCSQTPSCAVVMPKIEGVDLYDYLYKNQFFSEKRKELSFNVRIKIALNAIKALDNFHKSTGLIRLRWK